MQRHTSFDTTKHMRGELIYSSLRVLHLLLVREKITFHGVIFDPSLRIKALVLILKGINLAAQQDTICEKTGNIDPNMADLNDK